MPWSPLGRGIVSQAPLQTGSPESFGMVRCSGSCPGSQSRFDGVALLSPILTGIYCCTYLRATLALAVPVPIATSCVTYLRGFGLCAVACVSSMRLVPASGLERFAWSHMTLMTRYLFQSNYETVRYECRRPFKMETTLASLSITVLRLASWADMAICLNQVAINLSASERSKALHALLLCMLV